MKKYLKWIILIVISILIIYKIHERMTTKHHLTYLVNHYRIKEKFNKKENSRYDIIITKEKQTYIYTIYQKLNHSKKIINKIKTYTEENVTCIIPFYQSKISTELYCNMDQQQVSIDYLQKTNNANFINIKEKVKKQNINIPKNTELKTKYESIEVYNQNITPQHIYYLWNYKGIYVLEKEKNSYHKVLDYDLYDNVLSCIVNSDFVLLENTSVQGIKTAYYYNAKKEKVKKINLKGNLSKDSYINGVINKQIYITDRKNKKQYTLDIYKEKLTEVTENEAKYITYMNNKRVYLSKSDFFLQDQIFNTNIIESNQYVYYQEGENLYKYLKGYKKNPILLIELADIKEWKVKENEVILIKNDTLYSYNDQMGLRKIVESNELNYNYKNVYKFGVK